MDDSLFLLITDITNDELACGHDHTYSTPPARCITTVFAPEDNNMGDEAFVRADAYL